MSRVIEIKNALTRRLRPLAGSHLGRVLCTLRWPNHTRLYRTALRQSLRQERAAITASEADLGQAPSTLAITVRCSWNGLLQRPRQKGCLFLLIKIYGKQYLSVLFTRLMQYINIQVTGSPTVAVTSALRLTIARRMTRCGPS